MVSKLHLLLCGVIVEGHHSQLARLTRVVDVATAFRPAARGGGGEGKGRGRGRGRGRGGGGEGRGGVTNKGGMGVADEWGEGGEGLGRGKNK